MKKLFLFLAMFLMLLSVAGCKKEEEKILTVATNAEFAPFEYTEGSDIVGFDIELIKKFGESIGYTVVIDDQDFDAALLAVSNDRADLAIAAITCNEKRQETLDFSNGYFTASQVVIVKENSAITGTSVEDIKASLTANNAKIGVQRGTTGQYYAEGDEDWDFEVIEGTSCIAYDNGALAINALLSGKIDAVVIDEAPALLYVEKNDGIKVLDCVLTDEEYAVAFPKGETDLIEKFNDFLKTFKENGEYDKLIKKYFGE